MTLQVFPNPGGEVAEPIELIGDPARLTGRGYDARDERTWTAVPGAVAFGLGAPGPSFEACCARFGEFLAVDGFVTYRPSAGSGRPDFEHAAGAFVPTVHVLYGLAYPIKRATVVRFEADGEPGSASVALSQIAQACLDQAGRDTLGLVLAGESGGLVGAALTHSPVTGSGGLDPFAHPEAARLALVHARAGAQPEHCAGGRRRQPEAGPRAGAFCPAAGGARSAGSPGSFSRRRRSVPAVGRWRRWVIRDGRSLDRARAHRIDPPPLV